MTTTIYPLGDSQTWGYSGDILGTTPMSGYRGHLLASLAESGYEAALIGPHIDLNGRLYHNHPGVLTDQYVTLAPPVLAAFEPDVILLMLGTREAISATPLATMIANFEELLDALQATKPDVPIVVCAIPDTTLGTTTAFVDGFNAALVSICSSRDVTLVVPSWDEALDISVDQFHLNDTGYQRMAAAMFRGVASLLPLPSEPATICAEMAVSWDGSGDFDGAYDDVTASVAGTPGISLSEWRDRAQALAPPKINFGGAELFNDDGRWSGERPDSPVYQRVLPGRPVRYRAHHGWARYYRSPTTYRAAGPYRGRIAYALGRHLIEDISQTTELGSRRVRLDTIGYETVLTRAPITVPVMVEPLVSDCVTAILDAVAWPSDKRNVAVSDTQLEYFWCDERMPWDALLELLGAEGPGSIWVSRAGVFHYENRNYKTIVARSTDSQATFNDRTDGHGALYRSSTAYRTSRFYRGRVSGLWFTNLTYDPGFKSLFNRATYTTRRRAAGAAGTVVWQYGAAFGLSASQVRTLIARPSDPFQAAITPTAPTDYTVAGGTVSVTLSASSGLVAFITVTALTGTPTVTGLQLRATPLTVLSETTVQNTVDASASIARFSPIPGQNIPLTLAVSGWPELEPAAAEGVCDAWVLRYQVPRPTVTMTLRNADARHVEQILERIPSDRITLSERNTGLERDVWVNSAELRISGAGGRVVELALGCEVTDELAGAVWDLAIWDAPESLWGV